MATNPSAWPFKEAHALSSRLSASPPDVVTFQTGFGPSGLPHIGTFAEVARTTWVRHAFSEVSHLPNRLIVFCDDMDGLRKVPLNVPNREMLTEHLGKPLCTIPDPFGEQESYSGYMNNKLRRFLDTYGFDYDLQSSREAYTRGDFDSGLSILLAMQEDVRALILPTLREDKRKTWSPFFPVCRGCGRIYSTRVTACRPQDDTLDYVCDQPTPGPDGDMPGCGHSDTTSVLGGRVKTGWKVDWALRWYSYNVNYEMYGKDLIESAKLSGKIVRMMGGRPPAGLVFEMFLDEEGRKISKSVGKGLMVDTWVSYAPLESLLYFLYQNPKRAKRLYWETVPRSVDDYLAELTRYSTMSAQDRKNSAVWHMSRGGDNVPTFGSEANYSLITNIISGTGSDDEGLIWDFVKRHDPAAADYREIITDLIHRALCYYRDQVLPHKHFRTPTEAERELLIELREAVSAHPGEDEEELQSIPFTVAREHDMNPKDLFRMVYEVLLGQERGPRFGTLIRLIGKDRALALLDRGLAGKAAEESP